MYRLAQINQSVPVHGGDLLPIALLLLSEGAAAIHFAVLGDHFREFWAYGLFFAVFAWFQALWPVALVTRPSTTMAVLGFVVNALIVDIWVLSRTFGLPVGPDAGVTEAVGVSDSVATIFEALIVSGCLVMLRPPAVRLSMPVVVSTAALFSFALAVISLTVASLVVDAGGDSHGGSGSPDAEQHER